MGLILGGRDKRDGNLRRVDDEKTNGLGLGGMVSIEGGLEPSDEGNGEE